MVVAICSSVSRLGLCLACAPGGSATFPVGVHRSEPRSSDLGRMESRHSCPIRCRPSFDAGYCSGHPQHPRVPWRTQRELGGLCHLCLQTPVFLRAGGSQQQCLSIGAPSCLLMSPVVYLAWAFQPAERAGEFWGPGLLLTGGRVGAQKSSRHV